MGTVILAVAPIFCIILLGWALKCREFPAPNFWPVAEALTYYVLRITSYNVCYTKLLRMSAWFNSRARPGGIILAAVLWMKALVTGSRGGRSRSTSSSLPSHTC